MSIFCLFYKQKQASTRVAPGVNLASTLRQPWFRQDHPGSEQEVKTTGTLRIAFGKAES